MDPKFDDGDLAASRTLLFLASTALGEAERTPQHSIHEERAKTERETADTQVKGMQMERGMSGQSEEESSSRLSVSSSPSSFSLSPGDKPRGHKPKAKKERETVSSRPRVARSRVKAITFQDLQQHFDLPLEEVCLRLGICRTVLKSICRRFGIKRWPCRQIRSLTRSIEVLRVAESRASNPFESSRLRQQISDLQSKRQSLLHAPASGRPRAEESPLQSQRREEGGKLRQTEKKPSRPGERPILKPISFRPLVMSTAEAKPSPQKDKGRMHNVSPFTLPPPKPNPTLNLGNSSNPTLNLKPSPHPSPDPPSISSDRPAQSVQRHIPSLKMHELPTRSLGVQAAPSMVRALQKKKLTPPKPLPLLQPLPRDALHQQRLQEGQKPSSRVVLQRKLSLPLAPDLAYTSSYSLGLPSASSTAPSRVVGRRRRSNSPLAKMIPLANRGGRLLERRQKNPLSKLSTSEEVEYSSVDPDIQSKFSLKQGQKALIPVSNPFAESEDTASPSNEEQARERQARTSARESQHMLSEHFSRFHLGSDEGPTKGKDFHGERTQRRSSLGKGGMKGKRTSSKKPLSLPITPVSAPPSGTELLSSVLPSNKEDDRAEDTSLCHNISAA